MSGYMESQLIILCISTIYAYQPVDEVGTGHKRPGLIL